MEREILCLKNCYMLARQACQSLKHDINENSSDPCILACPTLTIKMQELVQQQNQHMTPEPQLVEDLKELLKASYRSMVETSLLCRARHIEKSEETTQTIEKLRCAIEKL